jgi:hypothetical protein
MNTSKEGAFACASQGIGQLGLTKREYFAGLALQGLLASDCLPVSQVARMAVDQADFLLKALEDDK